MANELGKLKRFFLWIPAKLYELGVRLRVAAYDTGYLKPKRLKSTVISIGNITVGGTGKTPLVGYIARYLRDEGYSVAILTRGYSRVSNGRRMLNAPEARTEPVAGVSSERSFEVAHYREYGDEPLMLARSLATVPVIIDKNRYEAGSWAEDEFGADAMILDDGYQHLALARDLNILLIDATDPFGGFEMMPFGRLREPLYGLRRAHLVIITRADRPFDQAGTLSIIGLFCGENVPVLYLYTSITELRHLSSDTRYEVKEFRGWNVALMCGIGNPEAFAEDVLNAGINIVSEDFFADHHAFTQQDLDNVQDGARGAGADAILITEKDAVRLEGLIQGQIPIYAAVLEVKSDDEVRLKSILLRTLVEKRREN
jgi:tetraacyldisaccharide 4'-kinase